MIEILISLAITALLLVATAVAFDAALTSYRVNHDMSLVSMSTRNCLHQMTSTIRSAWNDPAVDTIDVNGDGTECALVDATGRDIIYRYEAAQKQLQVNVDGNADWYVFLDNVDPIAVGEQVFTATAPTDGVFPSGTVGKVEIKFKTARGQANWSVSAAAVPRNILYIK
ncbi:MAG: hypothetical protein GY869_11355 [Planctomycetes bacterium]|nr:hypothetical protein [Planctomycetota bacterium]